MTLPLARVTQLDWGFSLIRMSSEAPASVGKIHDRNVGHDTVIVCRIPLRDGQTFASALRATDVIVETRAFAIDPPMITIAASWVFFICK